MNKFNSSQPAILYRFTSNENVQPKKNIQNFIDDVMAVGYKVAVKPNHGNTAMRWTCTVAVDTGNKMGTFTLLMFNREITKTYSASFSKPLREDLQIFGLCYLTKMVTKTNPIKRGAEQKLRLVLSSLLTVLESENLALHELTELQVKKTWSLYISCYVKNSSYGSFLKQVVDFLNAEGMLDQPFEMPRLNLRNGSKKSNPAKLCSSEELKATLQLTLWALYKPENLWLKRLGDKQFSVHIRKQNADSMASHYGLLAAAMLLNTFSDNRIHETLLINENSIWTAPGDGINDGDQMVVSIIPGKNGEAKTVPVATDLQWLVKDIINFLKIQSESPRTIFKFYEENGFNRIWLPKNLEHYRQKKWLSRGDLDDLTNKFSKSKSFRSSAQKLQISEDGIKTVGELLRVHTRSELGVGDDESLHTVLVSFDTFEKWALTYLKRKFGTFPVYNKKRNIKYSEMLFATMEHQTNTCARTSQIFPDVLEPSKFGAICLSTGIKGMRSPAEIYGFKNLDGTWATQKSHASRHMWQTTLLSMGVTRSESNRAAGRKDSFEQPEFYDHRPIEHQVIKPDGTQVQLSKAQIRSSAFREVISGNATRAGYTIPLISENHIFFVKEISNEKSKGAMEIDNHALKGNIGTHEIGGHHRNGLLRCTKTLLSECDLNGLGCFKCEDLMCYRTGGKPDSVVLKKMETDLTHYKEIIHEGLAYGGQINNDPQMRMAQSFISRLNKWIAFYKAPLPEGKKIVAVASDCNSAFAKQIANVVIEMNALGDDTEKRIAELVITSMEKNDAEIN